MAVSISSRPTVAFLYGVGEGKRISKKFRDCLGKHDFHHQLPYSFIQLNHLHDDLWQRPDDYVRLLRYLRGY